MRYRQVHLDFHTSEVIKGIGASFNKEQFQRMLKKGHVDSITIFSKCHHGWAYHPSAANEIHPELQFDLLGEMIEAAHEINVKTPVYISAGLDEKMARRRPDWLIRNISDQTQWVQGFMVPGYHEFCFNSPYLDYLLNQIEEVVRNYDADGIFLDIVGARTCYCQHCVAELRRNGEDLTDESAIKRLGEKTYAKYTSKVKDVIHSIKPNMPIFHNGGHILRGRRDLVKMNTHLELESLPTGGWGYDHFPLSARYAQTLDVPFLGMTGKFHTTWGEFGGYKHPNALRYETSLSLANGARISIGDQLHPNGLMDETTYSIIGAAYSEVEQKEPWCRDVTNIADVALLSLEAIIGANKGQKTGESDAGAVRMLLEGNILFDVIDTEADFTTYKVIILPDQIVISSHLKNKLNTFCSAGGQLLATGRSGLNEAGTEFALDLGVKWIKENEYKPDYFKPKFPIPNLGNASFIFYSQGQKVELNGGVELGTRENPYFNRETFTFCSHQHTPSSGVTGGPGMVQSKLGIYIAWNVFEDYATKGSLILRETILHALKLLLPHPTIKTNLPAQGITTLQHQKGEQRYINHLLYVSPVKRGKDIEVIEDIVPLHDVQVSVLLPHQVNRVYLAPQNEEINFNQEGHTLTYTVPLINCHQMIIIE